MRAAQTLVFSQDAAFAPHITAILVVFVVSWCEQHKLFSGGNCGCLPPDGFWRDDIVFVAKHIREKSRCKKRICDVLDPSISSYNEFFSSLNASRLLPFGSNKLCIFVSALGLSSL